ncbi:hypothetical protein M9H77_17993 [Catharanthus roseus]|uniref:Uncharacterized protein n=1 Tax=Catharanthus roseus TaxID=4058 RepID=A0ACC0B665_CATRO|nr:hypothetical protein M9H77_17993 [Catharanthus roseus]
MEPITDGKNRLYDAVTDAYLRKRNRRMFFVGNKATDGSLWRMREHHSWGRVRKGGSESMNRRGGVLESRASTSMFFATADAVDEDVEGSAFIVAPTRGIIGGNGIALPSGNLYTPPFDVCEAPPSTCSGRTS